MKSVRRCLCVASALMPVYAAAQAERPARPAAERAQAAFIARAFEMRRRALERGDQPYGAVVVCQGRIVGEGISSVVSRSDPTAHAEVLALQDAQRKLGKSDLSDCELFGSSRACSMCEAAAFQARISTMYFGETGEDAGKPRPRSSESSHNSQAKLQSAAPSTADLALFEAAIHGDLAAIAHALRQGARIDGMNAQGFHALMLAARANHVMAVKALIDYGADINLRDSRSDNPFLYAGAAGQLDILRLAIASGANTRLTNRFGGTALIPAAEKGHVDVVREILTKTDTPVNHVNNLGWTALMEAVVLSNGGSRHQEIVKLLIDHGADVNLPDKDGVTALRHARARGFGEIVKQLERAGAR